MALLQELSRLFIQIADYSQIVIEGEWYGLFPLNAVIDWWWIRKKRNAKHKNRFKFENQLKMKSDSGDVILSEAKDPKLPRLGKSKEWKRKLTKKIKGPISPLFYE
jgi:hypothetical protein